MLDIYFLHFIDAHELLLYYIQLINGHFIHLFFIATIYYSCQKIVSIFSV